MYKHNNHSVENNMKKIQITTKRRYRMMRKEQLRYKIEIIILKVLPEHAHMIVDCSRTMSGAKLMSLLKWFFSYLLFRICPNLRKRYSKGHFWNKGYFCDSVGVSDFEQAYSYIENQEEHHCIA